MSQVVEKLKRLSQRKGAPMGFGVAKTPPASPSFILVAGLTRSQLSSLEKGSEVLDAVFLLGMSGEINQSVDENTRKLVGSLPLGAELSAFQIDNFQESGYDFVLFDAEKAPASMLELEQMGRFLCMEETMGDSLVRAAARLPIDALALDLRHTDGISVGQLLFCQRCTDLAGKPLVAIVNPGLAKADLMCLRDVGVKGLIVTATEGTPMPNWTSWRGMIDSLPPRSRREERPIDVVLPLSRPEGPAPEVEEEEEDEEDD